MEVKPPSNQVPREQAVRNPKDTNTVIETAPEVDQWRYDVGQRDRPKIKGAIIKALLYYIQQQNNLTRSCDSGYEQNITPRKKQEVKKMAQHVGEGQ